MSVRLSAWNNSAPTERTFIKYDISAFFRTSIEKIQVLLKSDNNSVYFAGRPIYIFHHTSLTSYNDKCLRKYCRENQNTYFTFSNIWRKSYRFWDNVEKLNTAGQATDDNTAHARCKLDTWGYRHTLRICAANCFSRQ